MGAAIYLKHSVWKSIYLGIRAPLCYNGFITSPPPEVAVASGGAEMMRACSRGEVGKVEAKSGNHRFGGRGVMQMYREPVEMHEKACKVHWDVCGMHAVKSIF